MTDLGSLVAQYGYIGIFFVLVLGIIGLPLPDEVLLTYVGYSVYLGRMSLKYSIFIAILGSIIGISISYLLGKKLGIPFIKRFGPKLRIKEKNIIWAQNKYKKYGGIFLLFGYFIPGVRHITAYLAGISNYRYSYFAIFAYLGAVIWASAFIILGTILGDNWEIIERIFYHASKAFWILLFIVLLFIYIIRSKKKSKT